MTMKMKDSELLKLMAEVSAEVDTLLKAEAPPKDEESSSSSSSDSASGSPAVDNPDESSASISAGSPEASGSPDGSRSGSPDVPPPDAAAAPAGATPPAAGPPADAAPVAPADGAAPAPDQGQPDVASLTQAFVEIGQKNPEELKTYYLACVAAIKQVMGGGEAPAPEAPAAPAAPAPSAPPAPSPMGKSEIVTLIESKPLNFGEVKEIKDLREEVDTLSKAMKMMLEVPVRKAVTGISYVNRTVEPEATPTREETLAKLDAKISDISLSKSDRARITSYAIGTIGFDGIKDLLK